MAERIWGPTAEVVERLVKQIRPVLFPLLAGHPPEIQGAVLADLTATWLAGHVCVGDPEATTNMRESLLDLQIATVRALIPVNAMPERHASESLPVSANTCSVQGNHYKATSPAWLGLDFSSAEIRRQSTLMVAVFGLDKAPYDLHLRVPFRGWQDDMYSQVRPLMEPGRKWKGRRVASVEIAPAPERSPPWVINVRYADG